MKGLLHHIRSWYSKNLSDRYIVITSRNGTKSYRITSILQVLLIFIFSLLLIWASALGISFIYRKKSLDAVYSELAELRAINSSLVNKIKDINEDLDSFAKYISGKKKSSSSYSIPKDGSYKKIFQASQDTLNSSMYHFVHSVNTRIGFLLDSIQSTGFDPYRFVQESKENLERVKLSNTKLVSSTLDIGDSYRKRRKYYYFHSKVLDDAFKTALTPKVKAGKAASIMSSLESIFAALPINAPMPKRFVITSKYGIRKDPFLAKNRMHHGIDLSGGIGAKVVASGPGTVAFAGFRTTYGYTVDIDHGYGLVSRYAHLNKLVVAQGQKLSSKDLIGFQGKTGTRCKGSHLHYELHQNKKPINPLNFIYARKNIQDNKVAYFSK